MCLENERRWRVAFVVDGNHNLFKSLFQQKVVYELIQDFSWKMKRQVVKAAMLAAKCSRDSIIAKLSGSIECSKGRSSSKTFRENSADTFGKIKVGEPRTVENHSGEMAAFAP